MDARTFGMYLKDILNKKALEYENPLLTVAFDNIADGKRISGIRDALIGIANSMESALKDFYEVGNNTSSTPQISNGDNQ